MDRQKIAKALYDAGYTPSQIADMFGVSPATVRRWLRGAPTPTASRLEQAVQRLEALISRLEALARLESSAKPESRPEASTEAPEPAPFADNLWVKALRKKAPLG